MTDKCCSTCYPDTVDRDFDLIVVGAGSAGFSASITASDMGKKVALIGDGTIGGTCVNVGCVPSKNLMRAAEALHNANNLSRFAGIDGEAKIKDWPALLTQKGELVSELRNSKYIDVLSSYPNIKYMEGKAVIVENGVTANGKLVKSDKVIIATGSSPAIPSIKGIDDIPYLTSTTAFELKELPGSMLVIGGGYIGCEIAQIFARFGVKITIVCRSRLLPSAEPEISEALTSYLKAEGITIHTGLSYKEIRNDGSGIALTVEIDGEQKVLKAQKILAASGRVPNTKSIDLKEAGIELNENGGIEVDRFMQTSKAGTYAAGDVTGRHQFVYMAAYGAKIAATNAFSDEKLLYDATAMPSVTFTDPQVASVGLTEKEALSKGFAAVSSILPLNYLPRALAARDIRGLIKLVAEKDSGKLLGAHILAPEGADSIQTAVMAIKHGITVQEVADIIFPYLTTVEGLKLAAQGFNRDITKLSCCSS